MKLRRPDCEAFAVRKPRAEIFLILFFSEPGNLIRLSLMSEDDLSQCLILCQIRQPLQFLHHHFLDGLGREAVSYYRQHCFDRLLRQNSLTQNQLAGIRRVEQ